MTTTSADHPPSHSQGAIAPIAAPNALDPQRDFLRYARDHVRGVARRARFASVFVAVTAILLTGGVTAYTALNTLSLRDTVTRQIAADRDDLARATAADRAELHRLATANITRAADDAKTFDALRQSLTRLQSTADALTDTYAVLARDQAQVQAALDATKKRLDAAQLATDRALKAADDARAAATSAALPLDQLARIADAQKTAERLVQLARADLGEIQNALTLIQDSKDRGLPRLTLLLEEAEVAHRRIANLAKDAAALHDSTPAAPAAQPSAAADPRPWPERGDSAQAR